MNLVLIGYRGSGKSLVARQLAKLLNMDLACLDDEIEARAGMSINQIVQKDGWDAFREIQRAVVRNTAHLDHLIIDTGGGVVVDRENVDILKQNGTLFWLQASAEITARRILGTAHRPPLKKGLSPAEEIQEVLAERTPLYAAAADYTIETSSLSPLQIAKRIIAVWEGG